MTVYRFFLRTPFSIGQAVCLSGNEHHHLSRVMRLKTGEEAELVNGMGALATARIVEMNTELTSLEILSISNTMPPTPPLILGIPFMRPSKLEWVIEKGTELGADTFLLYKADDSEKESLSEHQIERLHQLTISALKQSGRLYLPSLEILPHLQSLFSRSAQFLFGDPHSTSPLTCLAKDRPIVFITGPEKGFSLREEHILKQEAQGARINPNILRSETAPIAALSILAYVLKS